MNKLKCFWKENSDSIVKMFINQTGMTILGLVVSMATVRLAGKMNMEQGSRWPLIGGSIFAVCFYMFLLFYMTMEKGGKDGIKVEAGRMKYSPLKGLYMSLLANTPNILLAVFAIVGKAFVTNVPFFSADTVTEATPAFFAGLNSISELILKLLNGMYLGLQVEFFSGNPLFYLLMIVPSLLVCTLAYILGVQRILRGTPMMHEEKQSKYEIKKEKDDIYYQQ